MLNCTLISGETLTKIFFPDLQKPDSGPGDASSDYIKLKVVGNVSILRNYGVIDCIPIYKKNFWKALFRIVEISRSKHKNYTR